MAREQLRHGDVVGVVGLEMAVGVDDGIDRGNGPGRGVQLIHQGDAVFLERHGHPATADAQRPDPGDGAGQVLAAEGLVVEIETQLLIQVVVKTQAEIPRAPGQGHAQLSVFVGVHLHIGFLARHFQMDGIGLARRLA